MSGHVTSSYYSPNLGRSIALALVRNGRERIGGRIHAAMADRTVAATIVDPVFYDPEGKRQNG
jgi:sarcosine oxidase subunit alpha